MTQYEPRHRSLPSHHQRYHSPSEYYRATRYSSQLREPYHHPAGTASDQLNHQPPYHHQTPALNYPAGRYDESTMSEMNSRELAPPTADITRASNNAPPAAISTPYRHSTQYEPPGQRLPQSEPPSTLRWPRETRPQPTIQQPVPPQAPILAQPVPVYHAPHQQAPVQPTYVQQHVSQIAPQSTVSPHIQYLPATAHPPANNLQPPVYAVALPASVGHQPVIRVPVAAHAETLPLRQGTLTTVQYTAHYFTSLIMTVRFLGIS